jgi:hypothetical protein
MKSSGSEGITLREGFASKSTDKMLDFTRIREGERGGGALSLGLSGVGTSLGLSGVVWGVWGAGTSLSKKNRMCSA